MATRLKLTNFRIFDEKKIKFDFPTLIVGPNTSGKTTILEALFLLATTNTFRCASSLDFIKQGEEFTKLEYTNEKDLELRIIKQSRRAKKESFLDERQIQLSEFIGQIKAVVFSPDSLHIIKDSPAERRSFLNLLLSQSSSDYLTALLKYKRVRKERNELLSQISKGNSSRGELDFWNNELVEEGSKIIKERLEFIAWLKEKLPHYYKEISEEDVEASLEYDSNLRKIEIDSEPEEIREVFQNQLSNHLNQELKYQNTIIGPHRDDLKFKIGDRSLPEMSSQGEVRSFAFSLKMAEKGYLEKVTGETAFFLIDDPLSELDQARSKYLLKTAQKDNVVITALKNELKGIDWKNRFQVIEFS